MSFVSGLWPGESAANATALIASTVIATGVLLAFVRHALWPEQVKIIKGPLHTIIPKLSAHEIGKLEYKPDIFPGARDVSTPVSSPTRGLTKACLSLIPLTGETGENSMALSGSTNGAPRRAARCS